MRQRTLDIIFLCKNHMHKYWQGAESFMDAIKNYMADQTKTKVEHYTHEDMKAIMWTAMLDYLDWCDKPSDFMMELQDIRLKEESLPLRIAIALMMTQVQDENGYYVNDFDENLFRLQKENGEIIE